MIRQAITTGIRLALLLTLLGGIALVAPTLAQTPAAAQNGQNGQNGQNERNEQDEQDEPSADVGAPPAAAAPQTIWTKDPGSPNGSARLQNYGDHVHLCDHHEDNHGVGVRVKYTHEDGRRITDWYWYGGGPKGRDYACRDINLRIKEWTTVTMKVCLADHTKKGGREPVAIGRTCDSNAFLNNG